MGIFHGDITIRHDTKQLAVSGNGKFHPPNSGNFKVKIWENHDEQLRFRGKRFSGKRWQKPSRMASRSSRINITGTVVRGWGLPENSARNLRPSPACPLIFVAIYMGLPSLLQQVPLLLLQVLYGSKPNIPLCTKKIGWFATEQGPNYPNLWPSKVQSFGNFWWTPRKIEHIISQKIKVCYFADWVSLLLLKPLNIIVPLSKNMPETYRNLKNTNKLLHAPLGKNTNTFIANS